MFFIPPGYKYNSNRKGAYLGIIIIFVFIVIVAISLNSCQKKSESKKAKEYNRVISLAPSITEMLYFLGVEDRIFGVTSYCNYPLEAKKKPVVGSFMDLNLEVVTQAKPDLIILMPSASKSEENLQQLGFETLVVSHNRLADIFVSLRTIGQKLSIKDRANFLADSLENEIKTALASLPKTNHGKKVLISTGREFSNGISSLYAAGKETFFDDIIQTMGMQNIITGRASYPQLSLEAILELDPDIIIDLIPELYEKNIPKEIVLKDWQRYPQLKAVKNREIFVLGGRHISIPGPRLVQFIKELCTELNNGQRTE